VPRSMSLILPILAASALALLAGPADATESAVAVTAERTLGAGDPAATAASPAPLIGPASLGGLTADQVAARAVQTSPGLRGDIEETVAKRYAVRQARAGFVPRLSGALSYARTSRQDNPVLGNLVVASPEVAPGTVPDPAQTAAVPVAFRTATLDVPLSDYVLRLPQLQAAAQRDAHAAELLLGANRLKEARDARIAYYDWVKASLQHRVAERSLGRARTHLGDAQTAHALGSASQADVLAVEAQVANAEHLLARALAATQIQSRRLALLMHDPAPVSYQIGEDLELPIGASPAPQSEGLLLQRALQRRLEPQVLTENADAQRKRAVATLATELPRLDASGSIDYARPNSRVMPPVDAFRGSWQLGVRLSWAPTDIAGNDAGRQALLARARQLDAQRDELNDAIALEVRTTLALLHESEVRLGTSQRALAAASEAYRVRRELFINGRATSTELTDADTDWSEAQLEAVSACVDLRVARVKLRHALGEDVETAG
jgi:outer membrane protein TolC